MVPAATSIGTSTGASKTKPGVKPTIKGGGHNEGNEGGEGRQRVGGDDD